MRFSSWERSTILTSDSHGVGPNKRINTTRQGASPLRGLTYWRARYAQHVRNSAESSIVPIDSPVTYTIATVVRQEVSHEHQTHPATR